jgi:hypothetical protein
MHDKICHNITKYCKNITKNITQLEFVIFSQKYDRIYEENIRRIVKLNEPFILKAKKNIRKQKSIEF